MPVKKRSLYRLFADVFVCAFLLLLLPGCREKETSMEYSQNETVMQAGETRTLQTNAYPPDAENQIEALPLYGDKVIITNGSAGSLYETESIFLSAEIAPENAVDQTILWSSDDPSTATVDNGKVTGVRSGKTFIRATTANNVAATYSITVKPSTKLMRVTITKTCSDYNHVGNEWGFSFSINGGAVSSGDKVSVVRNEDIRVYTEVTEYDDQYDDVGTDAKSVTVTTEYFESGFTVTQTITVMENGGRYSGNVAIWTVKYTFH